MEARNITEIMNKLESLPYQKILFDGAWGVGKTKHINDFIKDKSNIYYISLFGKKDIDSFYQELYYLLASKHKSKIRKVLNNIGKINFSRFGFNLTIPLISDVFESVQKEVVGKANITLIIDDLERRNDTFDLKEVFGFVDSIAQNEDVKIILVTSSENFSNDSKATFEEYTEKAIDRLYKISTYSNDAPQRILGEEVWSTIEEDFENFKLKNLRTLEKTSLFINEVINETADEKFNNKFNKEDIYKICFAVVLFVVEHNCEMKLLPKRDKGELDTYFKKYVSRKNYPNYIWQYILRRKLNNSIMNNLIPVILNWYLSGGYSKERWNEVMELVNAYEESTLPLFMSEAQIKKEIDDFSTFIKNTDGNISIKGLLQRLDELANIAEKLNWNFKYSTDEVVEKIMDDTDFVSNFNDSLLDIFIRRESKFINEVISKLQSKIKMKKEENLIRAMIENTIKKNFTQTESDKLLEFKNYINELKREKKDKEIKELIQVMRGNSWFLPLPLGEISHSHWTYCHNVFQCIQDIGFNIDSSIIEEVSKSFNEEMDSHSDGIFKYRLQHLIMQYL